MPTKDETEVKTFPEPEGVGLDVMRPVVDEDEDGHADSGKDRYTVGVYQVLIERTNNEKISAEVYEFEIPVLELVHGEESVIAEDEPVFEVEMAADANDVMRMLKTKYNTSIGGDVVGRVYRDAKELSSKSGMPLPAGKAKSPPASENVDNRKKKKAK